MSPLDWALVETWKDAGIPLEAVLRGIDATFDKYDRRPVKSRKINSIAYCSQEVLAATEEMKEAAVGTERAPEQSGANQAAEVAAFLRRNADTLGKAKPPDAAQTLISGQAETLRGLAAEIVEGVELNLEDTERRLTVMEEKLFAALLTGTPDDDLVGIRAQADRELAPYRSKMSGTQIDQLMKQYINKKLLERYQLPRLSLFYM